MKIYYLFFSQMIFEKNYCEISASRKTSVAATKKKIFLIQIKTMRKKEKTAFPEHWFLENFEKLYSSLFVKRKCRLETILQLFGLKVIILLLVKIENDYLKQLFVKFRLQENKRGCYKKKIF